ncbi:major intrinsically disordered Notch2-binding receptor 1-like [Oncorhynchus kisutch]|uniref:major intrinsically disordered Notch2-binding receptor 1-like n=1 Tax=Oncorhynchus kisutch TaxID=8019 RepID=UPI0009A08564|nr:major intrinsically disordered Notch2-binding receptor 1-like [Oncorhynchus kisutch]
MASLQQEYPLVLLGILEELAAMRPWLSFQDLCRMVSTRFDLQHLTELRSLLFSAACRDPCFPATLFRDRVNPKGLGTSPIGVAADIVTIFNLIQMTGGVPEEAQAAQPMKAQLGPNIDQSPGPSLQISLPIADEVRFSSRDRVRTLSDSQTLSGPIDQSLLWPKSNYSFRKRASLPPDPLSLVSSSPPGRARAVSFDWRHNTPLFAGSGSIPGQAMQSIYLPLETDSESSKDSLSGDSAPRDLGSEPGSQPGSERHSCTKKRGIFKMDFHNQSHLVPEVTISTVAPRVGVGGRGRQELFTNRSFEMLSNPYPSPTVGRPSPERQAKHESLDDLQDSTYFGPGGTIPEWSPLHPQPPRTRRPGWMDKSLSLDDRLVGLDGSEGSLQRRLAPSPTTNSGEWLPLPKGWEGTVSPRPEGEGWMACSTGTQTDTMPGTRHLRSLVHADHLSFMTSMDNPDMLGEDDISTIFRFLDDMSMCGSTGYIYPPDGGPSAAQDTPEARRGRLGQLQRLFHSLDGSDDGGLKASVCKLLLRMGQIEQSLESLSEVKAEISQVLSFLQRLDEKMQEQAMGGRRGGRRLGPPSGGESSLGAISHPLSPGSGGSSEPQPLSVSVHSFGSLDWNRWGKMEENRGVSETKVGKKGVLSRQASCKSGVESKRPSIISILSARDWTVSFSKSKDDKDQPGKTGQTDQSKSSAQSHKLPPQKHSHLVEQVSNSSLFHQKGGGLTNPGLSSGLTSGLTSDLRLAEGRGAPVWTVEEREARMSPLDLQAQESLNPNNLEFWMEDIYTPGYSTLLRRKEANQRRAKACKLGALIFTSITIILVIVIPIATMSS